MKLIKPSEISGEIMTLLEEADEKVILVSPYCKFSKWYKLLRKFEELQERRIPVEFYVREGEHTSIAEVEAVGFDPIVIPGLHSKIYLNEKFGIVSSMNLLLSSDTNSLEIGYKTETKEELEELQNFYNRYIKRDTPKVNQPDTIGSGPLDLLYLIRDFLNQTPFKGASVYFNGEGALEIKTSLNTYTAFIWSAGKHNRLRISGILTKAQFTMAQSNQETLSANTQMTIQLTEGGRRYYDTVWGSSLNTFQSEYIPELYPNEVENAANQIANFVCTIDDFKQQMR